MNSKVRTSWNLSEYYSGLRDEKFLSDWNFFIELTENFIKNYSMKFHTFHTSYDFYLFYQDYEKIISLSEQIQYFLFYYKILEREKRNYEKYSSKILTYESDFQEIIKNFFEKIEYMTSFCDENFYGNLEKIIENQEFEKWKFFISTWIDSERKKRKIWKKWEISTLYYVQGKISDYISEYEEWQKSDTENKKEKLLEIFYYITKSRIQLAKMLGYDDFFEYQMKEYMICPYFVKNFIQNISKISDYIPEKNNDFVNNEFHFSEIINEMSVIFIEKFDYKDFFEKFFQNGNIHLGNQKNEPSFTTWIQSKNPYIYLNIWKNFWEILTFIHEMGHAFQMFLSKKNSCLQFASSPFLSEFCAIFFEKIFSKTIKYEKYEYSYFEKYRKNSQNNLSLSYEIFLLEREIFEKCEKNEFWMEDFKKFLKNYEFKNIDLNYFLNYYNIFYSPFYTLTYIFAIIFAEKMWDNDKENFEKIASIGGSCEVNVVFEKIFPKIWKKEFYTEILEKIFSQN